MPNSHSIMGRHLRYRLWIAALNHDIDSIRIFDDYLGETQYKKSGTDTASRVEQFKKLFTIQRKEIDYLRHTMHLLKMKLASEAKEGNALTQQAMEVEQYFELEKRYQSFRKSFYQFTEEFSSYVDESLQ